MPVPISTVPGQRSSLRKSISMRASTVVQPSTCRPSSRIVDPQDAAGLEIGRIDRVVDVALAVHVGEADDVGHADREILDARQGRAWRFLRRFLQDKLRASDGSFGGCSEVAPVGGCSCLVMTHLLGQFCRGSPCKGTRTCINAVRISSFPPASRALHTPRAVALRHAFNCVLFRFRGCTKTLRLSTPADRRTKPEAGVETTHEAVDVC